MATAERNPVRDRAEETLRHRWKLLGFDALLAPERQYIALYWLVGDVSNGGFDQYFTNSSGDLALLAVEGLKAVGAIESLLILERALAIFPPGMYSTDRETRQKRFSSISDDVGVIAGLDELDRAFYKYPEDFQGLALDRLAALYSSDGI
jgi:hypothetical protein